MSTDHLSPTEISDFALENGRTALTFIPVLPSAYTKSFVGGYPRLPAGMDWPTEGTFELMFLAQVDLADLPWRPTGWPDGGTLYFFHNPRLEDVDNREVAMSRGEDGAEYPSKFVYFASEGQSLATVKPKKRQTREAFFQYEGDGAYYNGRPIGPRLERDCLPHAALRFATHLQFYPGAWFNAQREASGMKFSSAYEKYGKALSHLHKVLEEKENDGKKRALAELNATWLLPEGEEEIDKRIYGGASLIDVDSLLQEMPEVWYFKRLREQTSIDPKYASWPETGGMVMHHASSVANSVSVGRSKGELPRGLAQLHIKEAEEWAKWGQNCAQKLLSQEMRDDYLDWARSVFRKTLKVYSRSWKLRPLRKHLVAPFGKPKGISERASQALSIAKSLAQLSDAREYGLRVLTSKQMSSMPHLAQNGYLKGALRGQLFGWGSELQTEVQDNAEHLCLAVIYGNRDISFDADFKLWLTQPLQPDAWQPVVAVNAID
ncbi:DUF1963 domain-containing protein [uncultured Pelagimonas sp.]|uniref:DUF1963 domain-containing protein n=1 Tax=uncultured Pelagimonas sp. TaxID=1618102 RepID=UPI002620B810|nr:DUF1963 domain-containing protein [uncultured Pelagimonas sp.]